MNKYLFLILAFSLHSYATGYVVVTHDSNPQNIITETELTQVLLANTTNWKDGKKIAIITYAVGTAEGDEISKKYLGMTNLQAKKHYLTKVFSGILTSVPPALESADEISEDVAKKPGSIAIIPDNTKLPGKVKILTVN